MHHIIGIALALFVAGCVPISSKEMAPMAGIYQQIPASKGLEKSIKLGDVRVGGAEGVIHPYSDNPVKQADYNDALQTALTHAKLLTSSGGKETYFLDANLVSLESPFKLFSLSITVNSTAHYRLRRAADNFIVWEETLKLPYTAKFSEAFNASMRARLAIANAIRENITHMIRVLSSKSESELNGKGT